MPFLSIYDIIILVYKFTKIPLDHSIYAYFKDYILLVTGLITKLHKNTRLF